MANLPTGPWNTGNWGIPLNPGAGGFVSYANLSSLNDMFPGPVSPFNVPGASLPPMTAADYNALRAAGAQRQVSGVLNQMFPDAPQFQPLNPTRVPAPLPPQAYGAAPVAVPPPAGSATPAPALKFPGMGGNNGNWGVPGAKYTAPATVYPQPTPAQLAGRPGSGPLSPPPIPPSSAGGGGATPKPGGGGGAATPPGTGAAGAPTPPPTPGSRGAGPTPTNTGTVYGPNLTTAMRVGRLPGIRSLPGWATADLSLAGQGGRLARFGPYANMAAGLGTGIALSSMPGFISQQMGKDPNSFGGRTAQDVGTASALGLIAGTPAAAAAGLGVGIGNAVGGSGGLGVANMLREAMGWAPTDDTIGDILGRAPVIGGLFGGGGEEAAPAGPAPLPPTPDSLAQIGSMAGLDPDSTQLLQSSFQSQVGVEMARFTANPAAYAEFQGVPADQITPEWIAQAVFQKVVDEELPGAVQQQGTRQAMLQNAAAYQEALAPYLAPLQAQAQQAASSLANAGPGFSSYATYAQQLPSIIENQIRFAPQVAALTEYQNLIDQQSQQTLAQMLGNGGGAGQSFDTLTAGQDQALLAG